jgi:hypothetical protein
MTPLATDSRARPHHSVNGHESNGTAADIRWFLVHFGMSRYCAGVINLRTSNASSVRSDNPVGALGRSQRVVRLGVTPGPRDRSERRLGIGRLAHCAVRRQAAHGTSQKLSHQGREWRRRSLGVIPGHIGTALPGWPRPRIALLHGRPWRRRAGRGARGTTSPAGPIGTALGTSRPPEAPTAGVPRGCATAGDGRTQKSPRLRPRNSSAARSAAGARV